MKTSRKAQNATTADASFIEFLDLAGHDLRVPITAMKGQMQLMQRRLRRQEGRSAELGDVAKVLYQIERLHQNLATFLEAAHVAQRRLEVLPAENDLVVTIERLISIYDAGDQAHTIVFEHTDDRAHGIFDRPRVEIVLSALLGNALKYMSSGEVHVRLAVEDDTARIEVSDRGPGVPVGERRRIFDAYTTGSNIENPGVGLGLFVAREVVRLHKGRMGVRARRGGGSTFWFTLPLHALSLPAEQSYELPSMERSGRARTAVTERTLVRA